MNSGNSLVHSSQKLSLNSGGVSGGSGILSHQPTPDQAQVKQKETKAYKQTQYSHLLQPPQTSQDFANNLQNNQMSLQSQVSTPQPTNLKQQILNIHLRSVSEQQQYQALQRSSQANPSPVITKQISGATPMAQENQKTRAYLVSKPPPSQSSIKSNLHQSQKLIEAEGNTLEKQLHSHKNSGGSLVHLNLVPPVHNIQFLEGSSTLSNFIKRHKKKRGDKKAKLSKLAIVGLGFNQNVVQTEDCEQLQDNIDKNFLLKPGQEMDSSLEEESEDDGCGVQIMLVAKQYHSIHLQDEIQGVVIDQTKSTIHDQECLIEGNHLMLSLGNDGSQKQKNLDFKKEMLEQELTEQIILFPDNYTQSKEDPKIKTLSQKSTAIQIDLFAHSNSHGDLLSTAHMSDPRISDFARSINRMSDITRQISSKVQQLRQSQIDDQKKIVEQEGQSAREEDQYEVEEENPEADNAWRYNNRDDEIDQQRRRKEERAAAGPVEDPGLKLKEGQVFTQSMATNLPKEVFETQIVDQYSIYGQNLLRTVLRQMGPPKTKYGQLLLNQIVQTQKQQQGQAVKKNDANIIQILKHIKSGNGNAAQHAAQLIQSAQQVPQQQNLANFNSLQQPNLQATSGNFQNTAVTIQQQKQNDAFSNGNRIFLSLADHQKKRFKTCVTIKTKDDKIQLAPLNYDIPHQLVDRKYLQTFVKRGPNGGIMSLQLPLIINEDCYEKMTSHYIRLKDVKKLYVRDETGENVFFQGFYDFEDQYETLEELDYYRRELRRHAAIEENRKKNLKMANVKAQAIKLQAQKQQSESPNLFRERYRYNYINWLKQQQRSDGKKLETSDSLNNLEGLNCKQINQIELMTVESFDDRMPTIVHTENSIQQPERQGVVVQIKNNKIVVGSNEVNRSKIGSFLQLINNAASGLGNNQNVQLSAIGSNIPLKSGQLQHQGSSSQLGIGVLKTPDKAQALGLVVGNGAYKLQKNSNPFQIRPESQGRVGELDPLQQTSYPSLELKSTSYQQAQSTLQSCKNGQLPQPYQLSLSHERQTSSTNFLSSPQQALNNLTQNFQLRQNVENELKIQHLQRDAGKLISKFEELNKEHEELEKLKRYAENHFCHGTGRGGEKDSFIGQQNQSNSLKVLHRPTQSGLLQQQSQKSPKLESAADYFALLNSAQFGDINNPSPLFGGIPGQLTVGPIQSQQRLQMKCNSASSTFGIKLQNQQSTQVHKVQQQSRFNIILANKKHNLQRKYMELIREKDQVLNEFYSYAKIASNVQKNLSNINGSTSSANNPLNSEINSPTKTQELAHKVNFSKFPITDDSQDTIGENHPSFQLQSKKVFIEEDSKSQYKTIQKDNSPIGILSQNGGRMGSYALCKSSKTKLQNNKTMPAQQNSRFLLPPAVSQQNNSRMEARVQVFSRKGLTSSQNTSKPLKPLNSPTKNQVIIEQQMTPPPPETIKEGNLMESCYTVEKDNNQMNIKIPNLTSVASASGVFSLYSISKREDGASINAPNNGSSSSNFIINAASQSRGINDLLKRRQSQNRIISNISSSREPQMYRGSYQKVGGDLEQILQMADVQQATKEVILSQPAPISNIVAKAAKPKQSHGSTNTRPSGEGGGGSVVGAHNSKLINDSPQKIIHKKPNTNA